MRCWQDDLLKTFFHWNLTSQEIIINYFWNSYLYVPLGLTETVKISTSSSNALVLIKTPSHCLKLWWPNYIHFCTDSHDSSKLQLIQPLWPSDTIWHHRTWSKLVQVMTFYLMAPTISQYLQQWWLIIKEGNFTANNHDIYPWYEFWKLLI